MRNNRLKQAIIPARRISILLIASLVLIGSSMASFLAQPAKPRQTRVLTAGGATLQVPLHMPKEIIRGTSVCGAAILGIKDDCSIAYDQFIGIYWSDRPFGTADLMPTGAYRKVSEIAGETLRAGTGSRARVRNIRVSAERPCGSVAMETLKVIEMHCGRLKTHVAVVGMLNPVVSEEMVVEIAESLRCP